MVDRAVVERAVLITDPMCSWCWGMADDFRLARSRLAGAVQFDLMLGGINTHGTQSIGQYGRRFLMKLWREVADTTGQQFGFQLPEAYVHNSVPACLALEAVRVQTGAAPFELLHDLQHKFFVQGLNITDTDLLAEAVARYGVTDFVSLLQDPALRARLKFQFDNAGAFGTNAMPSLLVEDQGRLRLLAGGYVDADMMVELLTR